MRRFVLLLALAVAATACASTAEVVADLPGPSESAPTGRQALAAAQGEPHVLWFWGAH